MTQDLWEAWEGVELQLRETDRGRDEYVGTPLLPKIFTFSPSLRADFEELERVPDISQAKLDEVIESLLVEIENEINLVAKCSVTHRGCEGALAVLAVASGLSRFILSTGVLTCINCP